MNWGALIWQSVVDPRAVARWLIDLRLSRAALVWAYALVVVLNALAFGLSALLPTPEAASGAAGVAIRPFVFAGVLAVAVALMIAALSWSGRLFGGTARIEDLAVTVIWLQVLRAVAQAVLALAVPLSLVMAGAMAMLASALGLWITANFIDVAHGFGSLFKALGALIVAAIGLAFVLSLLLSLTGSLNLGWIGYV